MVIMGLTDDPTDPRLTHGADDPAGEPVDQAEVYLVLSEAERARGFIRPVRRSYWHSVCGTVTTMHQTIAETYAANPGYYGATYCVACGLHRPVGPGGEFHWAAADGSDPADQPKVGT